MASGIAPLGWHVDLPYIDPDMVEPSVSDRLPPPAPGDRMQRVRVGVTGLAAVLIIIAVATAVGSGVRRSADASNATTPPPVVATLPATGNATVENTEPLAQLGAAPGGNPEPATESPKK